MSRYPHYIKFRLRAQVDPSFSAEQVQLFRLLVINLSFQRVCSFGNFLESIMVRLECFDLLTDGSIVPITFNQCCIVVTCEPLKWRMSDAPTSSSSKATGGSSPNEPKVVMTKLREPCWMFQRNHCKTCG